MTTQHKAAWLANARAALDPTPEDNARIATNLVKTLGPAAFVSPPEPTSAPLRPSTTLETAKPMQGTGMWRPTLKPMTWLTTGLLIGGLVGYNVGLTQRNEQPPTPHEPPLPSFELAPTTWLPEAPRLDPVVEDPITYGQPLVVTTRAFGGTRPIDAQPAASSVASAQPAEDTEVVLLQRVERALRYGNAALALGLLRELDDASPKGRLLEERSAARIIARCMLDTSDSRDEAERFEQQNPNSVHSARLRRACKL